MVKINLKISLQKAALNVNVMINIDKPDGKQYSQDFYCHAACLREKLHGDIKIHLHLHNILDD